MSKICGGLGTGKSLPEALLFAEHGENILCTKIVVKVQKVFHSVVRIVNTL